MRAEAERILTSLIDTIGRREPYPCHVLEEPELGVVREDGGPGRQEDGPQTGEENRRGWPEKSSWPPGTEGVAEEITGEYLTTAIPDRTQ